MKQHRFSSGLLIALLPQIPGRLIYALLRKNPQYPHKLCMKLPRFLLTFGKFLHSVKIP